MNFIKTIALALLLSLSASGFARPDGIKASSKLSREIQEMIAYPQSASNLSGEAVVYFTLNEDRSICVKGVMGTNEALIQHIEATLRDQSVGDSYAADQNYSVKIKFSDIRL